jgi:hypothetical protein
MSFRALVVGFFVLSSVVAGAGPRLDEANRYGSSLVAADSAADREATKLLQRKLVEEAGLDVASLASAATPFAEAGYAVAVDPDCSRNAEASLVRDGFRAAVHAQLESAAMFLADFHGRLLGNPVDLFGVRSVLVCTDPIAAGTPRLAYDRFRGQLRVRIGAGPTTWWRRSRLFPLSATELRRRWNAGDAWKMGTGVVDALVARRHPIRRFWPLLDPVGELRTALRELFRRDALRRVAEIERLDVQGLRALVTKLLGADRAAMLSESLAGEELERVVREWTRRLRAPESAEHMGLATAFALAENAASPADTDIDRRQIGLVNVENHHRIDVRALIGGAVEAYRPFVATPAPLRHRVRQYGVVNVATSDDVAVSACLALLVTGDASLDRATLAHSVDQTRSGS